MVEMFKWVLLDIMMAMVPYECQHSTLLILPDPKVFVTLELQVIDKRRV